MAQRAELDPPQSYWSVGQILTVGAVVDDQGKQVDSLVLEPQGIAHIISAERVTLPGDVCSFAHVLTRKCNEGLLTLNIGVVDPGWDNFISTPILNFSSQQRRIEKGQPFIRLTFHRVEFQDGSNPEGYKKSENLRSEDYFRGVRERSVSIFGKYFLNVKQIVGEASKEENLRLRETLLKLLPLAAIFLTVLVLLLNIGIAALSRFYPSSNTAPQDTQAVLQRLDLIEAQLKARERSSIPTAHPTPPLSNQTNSGSGK